MATTDGTPPPPPLERILPYVVSIFSAGLSFASALARFFTVLLSSSLSFFSPLPIILYLLAPILVFFDIVTDVFLRWPYQIALYALDAFYPIYVFCGVACIVGVLVGVTGRVVALFLVDLVAVREELMSGPEVVGRSDPRKKGKMGRRRRG
ncbi:hypothetical protein FPV67DRAFT_1672146 [Lyophyllum atratum]|nr:hypothetical protein FPV67DRAFT_1672146 [Lyophyllum atratum]